MSLQRRIFISMPADEHLAKNQNDLKWAIVKQVESMNYVPEVFTSTTQYFKKSIVAPKGWTAKDAYDIALRCSGAVIIGLPRWKTTTDNNERILFPSEFSHYEGALFKSLQLPIFIAAQSNIVKRVMFGHADETVVQFDENDNQDWVKTQKFMIPFDYWKNELYKRRDIFIGYCSNSSSTAKKIKKFLTADLGATVLDWQTDFSPTDTILSQIEQATARCNAGIFLFTKDDFLKEKKAGKNAVPRDNVVFEAGYFIHAKGNSRVLIILEEGAKMPADLGGKIYSSLPDKSSILPIKPLIKRFVDAF